MDTAERLLREARIYLETDEAQARITGFTVVADNRAALKQRIDAYLSSKATERAGAAERAGRETMSAEDCCCAIHHPNYGRCLQCPIHGSPPPDLSRKEKA